MNKSILLLTAASLFALVFTSRLASAESAPAKQHEHKTTELGKRMDRMKDAFRSLGRQIGDASRNADSLQLVATMHAAAEESLQFKPEKTADIPVEDQAEFVTDFHAGIKDLIADLDRLSNALRTGDNDEATEILHEIKGDQKEGHKRFRKKREHK